MRVAFRVDASEVIGSGHLKRCLSLARALAEAGAEIRFVCRALDAVAAHLLRDVSAVVDWLPSPSEPVMVAGDEPPLCALGGVSQERDASETAQALDDLRPDWVVVDHYAFDARWHAAVRSALGCDLLAIDDLADRLLDVDVVLDHNWDLNHEAKYSGRLQRCPQMLCGPRYALLASAYCGAPRYVARETVQSIGIFMGGTDPGGISARMLMACREAGFSGPIEVVSTSVNPHLRALQQTCLEDKGTTLTLDQPDLSAFFARHDLQIGAGGGATWERCCIGAPTVALVVADNQRKVVTGLASMGVVCAASEVTLVPTLCRLIEDGPARRALSMRASELVDGRGAQRVALKLLRDGLSLRLATVDDARCLHTWRNHPAIRAVSATQQSIAFEAHQSWLQSVLSDSSRWLFMAHVGQVPVGSIRFDRLTEACVEVSLYIDPELHGLGLGQRLLLAGERALLRVLPGGFDCVASVLPDNTTSQRMFEMAGYAGGPLRYRKSVSHR